MIRQLTLRGDAGERGWQHGKALKHEIELALEFYLPVFNLEDVELRRRAKHFAAVIRAFNPDYGDEIEAIAAAAGLESCYVYALNSRSELISLSLAECTSIFLSDPVLLAQNWDWSIALEPLMSLFEIEYEDGHRVLTVSEPGMIAKIGLNSAGLGVCLNILQQSAPLEGVPVHVMLRALLDCRSWDDAVAETQRGQQGKSSHILLGSADGNAVSIEFAVDQCHYLDPENGLLLHTNHYLCTKPVAGEAIFPTSHDRFSAARAYIDRGEMRDADDIRRMLLDDSAGELSINRSYNPVADMPAFIAVGTVLSLIMDLPARTLSLRLAGEGDQFTDYRFA